MHTSNIYSRLLPNSNGIGQAVLDIKLGWETDGWMTRKMDGVDEDALDDA